MCPNETTIVMLPRMKDGKEVQEVLLEVDEMHKTISGIEQTTSPSGRGNYLHWRSEEHHTF
jgi:hypothetical protein